MLQTSVRNSNDQYKPQANAICSIKRKFDEYFYLASRIIVKTVVAEIVQTIYWAI